MKFIHKTLTMITIIFAVFITTTDRGFADVSTWKLTSNSSIVSGRPAWEIAVNPENEHWVNVVIDIQLGAGQTMNPGSIVVTGGQLNSYGQLDTTQPYGTGVAGRDYTVSYGSNGHTTITLQTLGMGLYITYSSTPSFGITSVSTNVKLGYDDIPLGMQGNSVNTLLSLLPITVP